MFLYDFLINYFAVNYIYFQQKYKHVPFHGMTWRRKEAYGGGTHKNRGH